MAAAKLVALVLVCCWPLLGRAAVTTDNPWLVKAAYLFNFAKYVEWPTTRFTSTNDPICIGVLGDDPFGVALDNVVKNRTAQQRPVTILRAKKVEELLACHIVYIGASEQTRLVQILSQLRKLPVLTVGEQRDFLEQGGMVRLRTQRQSVVFDVHLPAADTAQLKLSARLLENAQSVIRKATPE
ncbi:MAG: YfiR family protein [Verrucomicrobiota bacterium]